MSVLTVKEVSRLTGVSVRALQYYDTIGLLPPSERTQAGYRLYDTAALERLQQIMLFREMEFSLEDIKKIVSSPDFDREKALEQQIELLSLRRDRLDGLIDLARRIKDKGGDNVEFKAFDKEKLEEYAQKAKEQWGDTDAYRQYEERGAAMKGREEEIAAGLMDVFARMGAIRGTDPAGDAARALVQELRDYITAHFYDCTPEILAGLGQMYGAGGEMSGNIDAAGGPGTAQFAAKAVAAYVKKP